jgi:hypothetical protein
VSNISPSQSTLNSWNAPREVLGELDAKGKPVMRSPIDNLSARFDGIYMQKWKSNFPSPAALANWSTAWSDALSRHGIAPKMAFAAIQRCEESFMWPPSLPEFLALCKPPLNYEQAWSEALTQMGRRHADESDTWPVPAVYWAAVDFGGVLVMRNTPYSLAADRWKRLLDKRRESECEPVPVFVPQLSAPPLNDKGEFITLAEARGGARLALRAMMDLAGRKPSRTVAIERARAVLARHAATGDVLAIQIAHAKHVLLALMEGVDEGCDDET